MNKLYLRDCFGIWYHGGLKGLTSSISETARFLSDLIVDEGFERVTFLGVSSGGYAALLLGKMIEVSRIRAISPRTFLDIDNRKRHGDFRLYHATSVLYAHPSSEKEYFDLRPVLVQSPGSMPPTRVFYDPFAEIDRAHVENIADVRGIELVEYPDTGHWPSLVLVNDRSFLADLAAPDE